LRPLRPLQYGRGADICRRDFGKRFVLELDAPIVFRDVGWLADT